MGDGWGPKLSGIMVTLAKLSGLKKAPQAKNFRYIPVTRQENIIKTQNLNVSRTVDALQAKK